MGLAGNSGRVGPEALLQSGSELLFVRRLNALTKGNPELVLYGTTNVGQRKNCFIHGNISALIDVRFVIYRARNTVTQCPTCSDKHSWLRSARHLSPRRKM
jgi:hypothetical protein